MATIDHVICPVDLSTPSANALRHATAWARWYHVPLRVLYVNMPPQVIADATGQTLVFPALPIDEVRAQVTDFVSTTLPGEPLPPIDVVEGNADCVIVEHLARWPHALLVMGTHGRTGIQHVLVGSVTERVSHATSNPLLIVPPHDATRPRAPIELNHIVCAVDFRPSSLAGLRYALQLARRGRQSLDLVTVTDWPRVDDDASQEEERERRGTLRDTFLEYVPDDVRQWCVIHEEVLRGAPAEALLTYAGDVGADVIVMGAGDHGWLHRLWLGSTTARVMRAATCPVLIVPAPRRQEFAAAKPLAKDEWTAELNRVSAVYSGKPATIAVLRDDMGTQREAVGLPFMGITAEVRDGGDEIAVMLASAAGSHLTHVVSQPCEVRVHENATREDVELVIVSRDGSTTLLDVGERTVQR